MKVKINKIKQKGIALVSVLMILVALMVLTMGFAHFTMQDWITGKSYHQANICFYLAQAGLEYTRYLAKHNMLIYPYAPYDDSIRDSDDMDDGSYAGGQPSRSFVRIDAIEKGPFTPGNDINDFDENQDGIIDVTEGTTDLPMAYNANIFDTGATTYQPGSIMNLYGNGHEHLLITRLAVGSDVMVQEILEKGNTCGTFRIRVIEDQDPNAPTDPSLRVRRRVLLVRSEGLVKNVPANVWANHPSTWDVESFPIVSRRTLMMRIPYNTTEISGEAGVENLGVSLSPVIDRYQILTDGWWERFR